MITLYDPKIGYPIILEKMPKDRYGFIMWRFEIREIFDIHETKNGIQIELFSE